eukprot:2201732-Prymnesium_polylepis.1
MPCHIGAIAAHSIDPFFAAACGRGDTHARRSHTRAPRTGGGTPAAVGTDGTPLAGARVSWG